MKNNINQIYAENTFLMVKYLTVYYPWYPWIHQMKHDSGFYQINAYVLRFNQCPMGSCWRRAGWPVRFSSFLPFVYIYIYMGWGGVGYERPDDHVLDTTLSIHVPPTRKTLMMQRDSTLTARWGGAGWDMNVLTTTSLILGCQHMFHQLGRRWWCNVMQRWYSMNIHLE